MKTSLPIFACFTLAAVIAADKSPKSLNTPPDGSWTPTAVILGGLRIPKEALDATTLVIDGPNYEVTIAGEKEPDRGYSKTDTAVTPHRITLVSTNGPNKGKTILGIYEVKSATAFRVCYDMSGKAFPTEFKAPKNTKLYLAGYRPKKAEK